MGDQRAPEHRGFEVDHDGGAPPFHAETFSDGIAEQPASGVACASSTLLAKTGEQAREDLLATDVPDQPPADLAFFAALTPTASPASVTDLRIPVSETALETRPVASRASDQEARLRVSSIAPAGPAFPVRRESLSAKRGLVAGTAAALALTVVAVAAGSGATAAPSASASASTTIGVVRPVEIHVPAPTVVVRKTVVRRIVGRRAAPAPATLPSSSPSPPPPPAAETAPAPAPRISHPPSAAPERSDEPSSFGGEFSP